MTNYVLSSVDLDQQASTVDFVFTRTPKVAGVRSIVTVTVTVPTDAIVQKFRGQIDASEQRD